ncbi:MAG: hypothetical protein ACUBOA_10135 [Candidatus Loosdrechtia sp.]|nr:MAG: hypothetical protein QY305_11095 [Candidatus Jettenia sp. AMX2]
MKRVIFSPKYRYGGRYPPKISTINKLNGDWQALPAILAEQNEAA